MNVAWQTEAGEVTTRNGLPIDFEKYPIGSFLKLLPWHSCAVAHQHEKLRVVDENDRVVDEWLCASGW